MDFQKLDLHVSYESSGNKMQLLQTFYNPVLELSKRYYRIAGYFSSTALIVAAEGIEALIKNDGKMYLLVSPELSEADYETIIKHKEISPDTSMFSDLKFDSIPNENIQALAWLLANDRLKIKIVVGKKAKNSLFHQKVGIFFDENNNIISFSGSINETAKAWLSNIEEFKVFKSWELGQIEYVQSDLKKFLSYWKNEHKDVAEVYDVPEAIKQKIIKQKPNDIWDLNIMRKYRKDKQIDESKLGLFPHQENAVKCWQQNGYRLLMEMATGTGKTRTAIGCVAEILKNKERLCIVVATPQVTITNQWVSDFDELKIGVEKKIKVDGGVSQWRKKLEIALLDLSEGKYQSLIIFTTHALASADSFIEIVRKTKYDTKVLFICDEVHAIGATKQRRALLPEYEYRIGLSATPDRMFDEIGTKNIRDYFGNNTFEFTIYRALHTINPLTGRPFLNPYKYIPIFVPLTEDEMKKYKKYSSQIAIMLNDDEYDEEELQRLYDHRAEVGKNARNKFDAFNKLIDEMDPYTISDTILFASDKQIKKCFEILSKKGIKRAKITENESASRIVNEDGETERQELISQFQRKEIQVLVGLKCLDEGIDISTARVAILMANSTNPREYIQRVGRVIRPSPEKEESVIYDFIITPEIGASGEAGILEKEAQRTKQIANNATNYEEVKKQFNKMGVNLDAD